MDRIYLNINEQKLELTNEHSFSIGRKGYGADIEIDDRAASRKHGVIEMRGGQAFVKDLNSGNGIKINTTKIEADSWNEVQISDVIHIVSTQITLSASDEIKEEIIVESALKDTENPKNLQSKFREQIIQKGKLSIGRYTTNDIVFDDRTVGRQHAVLSYEEGAFWIQDLGSKNKTYVNGEAIKSRTELNDEDVITIAFYSITLNEGAVDLRTVRNAISAVAIEKKYPNQKIGLQRTSLDVRRSTFVALMGPSGCGKSTLLKCLNGDNPATSGDVFIHGLSLLKNFNLIKKKIGYVPQDDIIHKELTVHKTLFYAAKLRLPDDTTNVEIEERISAVISDLNLDQDKEKDIRNIRVGDLSGGQRKRISIAVELLTQPTILFLDEPTSPLDPETIESFLKSLQKLAHAGTTIIMVTHKPEDLNYVDQVIFLGVQGHLVYKGSASSLTSKFGVQTIVEVYNQMSNLELVKQKYRPPEGLGFQKKPNPDIKRDKADSLWLQLYWLVSRYLNVKINDRENLFLLLAQPIIIAGLVCLVFNEFRVGVLFLMTISAIWFGVSNAAKEIVGELPIYKRERMFNINIHTYIFSKWMVLSLIALVQTVIFVSIIYLNFKFTTLEGFDEIYLKPYWQSIFFMFYISFSGSLVGLWLSASLDSTEKVMTVVPIALMPQIMLAGVMTKINNTMVEVLSFFTLGRWGTEGFARLQDTASEVELNTTEQLQSVLTTFPVSPDGKQTREVSSAAMDVLDLYNEELVDKGTLIGTLFNSFDANLMAVTTLNILFYGMIFYALKRKDSI